MSLNERSSSQGVNKSQRCNESTEIKYDPVSSTLNVDGLTSRIDGATTPLVDYSFSDDSFSEEKIVSSSLSVENIDKRKSLETTQITTTTSVMNDEKAEQVMIDLQRSMENEPQSLQNLAAQHEQNLAAQQVIGDLQENKKNEPKAQNLAVQKAQDRQAKAHERWKTKIAAIIRKAVTDLGSTQQNHTPAINSGVSARHEESSRSSR
ncbi:unnamed protein product, partial [Mesorhabditis belari]|uniref:Uncharacterized protein n=1 Tax=Mesorhabditis belari TaxID=2138241 RepID=A0AAF3FJI1_9BILA